MRKKRRIRKRKQRVKPRQDETVNTTIGANHAQLEPDRLPDHFTARPLHRSQILHMQHRRGTSDRQIAGANIGMVQIVLDNL